MNILTVNLLMSTLVFWIAARLTTPQAGRGRAGDGFTTRSAAARHATPRLDVVPRAVYAGVPPQFAYPAGVWRNSPAAALALIAIPAVATRARSAKFLVLLFSIEGTLDLIAAIVLATVYDAPPFMGAAYWIPALWVPALLVTHYITFILLLKRWP